jgi:hypothetical protein
MVIPTIATPPLRDGERMKADEFFRRYSSMPEVKKAELIQGVVYMGSPVGYDNHGEPHFQLMLWLTTYQAFTSGINGGDNSTVFLDDDNQPQPDVFLRIENGGTSRRERGYIEGPPELACEIAYSSLDRDSGPRQEMYREAGVSEYLIWRVEEGVFDWLRLRDGAYETLPMDEAGVIHSEVLPGLWLDTRAMIRYDGRAVLLTLQAGLASPEHAEFVRRLNAQ